MSGKSVSEPNARYNAQTIRQLSNLISAGIPPAQARELVLLDEPISGAKNVEQAFDLDQELELIWQLSSELGSPMGTSLRHLAANRERQLQSERQIQLAFAAPSMTAKLIGWLPLGSMALAQIIGLDPIGAITSNFLVVLAVLVGLALLATARYWTTRILLTAKPNHQDPATYIDCVAMAIEAGLPPVVATRRIQTRLFESQGESTVTTQVAKVDSVLALSAKTGAAAVDLLRSLADQERHDKVHRENETIAKLNIKLLLPIGLAVLPAFGLLTIVPVAFGFLGSNQ